MKIYLLSAIFLLISMASYGQSKLNPAGQNIYARYKETQLQAHSTHSDASASVKQSQLVIVILKDAQATDAIDIPGVTITSDLGGIVIAQVDLDVIPQLEAMPEVIAISFGDRMSTDMDYARSSCSVGDVQNGFSYEGSQLMFDGAGVVCGIMDIGLDANHVNFKNYDGSSRIQRLWHLKYDTSTGKVTSDDYSTSTIHKFTTDDATESHATHVAGIMSGSYKGSGTYAYMPTASSKSPQEINGNIPYYGVATGADLALSVGELYSPSIIQGITNIVKYAESVGKPAVINLSLGHTYGPHDGTDAYSQALALLGKRAIICMSAGNDGDVPMSITKAFTDADTKMQTQLLDNKGSGIVDVWTNDSKPISVKWALYSMSKQTFTDLGGLSNSGSNTISSTSNAVFSKYFSGSIKMQANVCTTNNRFNVYNDVAVSPLSTNTDMFLSLIIEGMSGQTIYVYGGTKVSFTSQSMTGWTDGSKTNSINDAACAENIISVGAYTTRTTWGLLKTGYYKNYDASYKLNKISPFSSYGTTFQGKQLPLICGPGAAIISSYNRYYVARGNSSDDMTAKATVDGVTNYWGSMQGTSMSCPYVTGTIGLWLQADPTLDFERVIDVINSTSSYNKLKNGTPQAAWGAGKIDALEGIKYVLANKAAIGEVWADDNQRLIVTDNGSGYEVFVADGGQLAVTLYDLQGRPVARATGEDGTATVDCGPLSSGLYILEARTASLRLTRKVARR